ncbi:MAG TPA: FG-GAP-like repeat-containing protein, partial [Candidatus Binatia bacterium]|nr:FG-GAP-like repeat-containing protein [Candidatus Binatia bacterium]
LVGAAMLSQFATVAFAQFTAITNGPVVTDHGDSTGCAWGDYDNDGYLDLFVSNFGTPFNYLYRNNGDGSFTRVTTGAIATDDTNSEGAIWGDYDNDGYLDLFVAVGLGGNDLLYRNNGDGSFTKITSGPVVQSGGNSRGCAWADYDHDGHLDLFVANEQGQNNFLFHNNGDGAFNKVTTGSLVNDGGASYGCAWGDYDNDGFPDLFVANLNQNNFLYHNNHDSTFTRITSGRVVNDGGASQGCAWGDYDNDGLLDLFVANRNQKNFLYHNDGNGAFTAITNGAIVNDVGYSWSPAWIDYDNDGYLDLFVVNGPPSGPGQNDFLYRNNGDGTFTRITTGSIVNDNAIGDGCAWGDYNNDGFLDLFVSNLNDQNNLLYRNNGNSNNWLTVRCVGQLSNRSGIGAKVRLKITEQGQTRWQMREISGGSGYGSQNAPYAYFGLGTATNIETVRVEWPSGLVQELHRPMAKQFLTVTEPVVSISPASLTLNAGETALFTATATLSPPLSFLWSRNSEPIAGATAASLVITNMQANDAGNYSLEISQLDPPMTVFAKPVSLIGPVVFQTNQQIILARPDSNATFQVSFTGALPIQLQWRHGEQPILNATNAMLTLTNVQLVDEGDYRVIASNSFGAVEAITGTLVILIRPTITVQPVSQNVVAGGNVILSVAASGHPLPLSYRWRKNGGGVTNMILYETNCFFTITNVQPNPGTNIVNYNVVVTNLAGVASLTSNAVLTVLTDTDGDGLPDEWETAHGFSITNATDAMLDSDGDGATNAEEYASGTNPNDPQEYLRLEYTCASDSSLCAVRFLAVSNRTYTLQARRDFSPSGAWRASTDVLAAPSNRMVEIIQQPGDLTNQQFFRLLTPHSH